MHQLAALLHLHFDVWVAGKNGGDRAASVQFLLILFVIAIDPNRNAALRSPAQRHRDATIGERVHGHIDRVRRPLDERKVHFFEVRGRRK